MQSCLTMVHASQCAAEQLRLSQASTRYTSQCSQSKTARRNELRSAIARIQNDMICGRNVKNQMQANAGLYFCKELFNKFNKFDISFFLRLILGRTFVWPTLQLDPLGIGIPRDSKGVQRDSKGFQREHGNPALRTALVSSTPCSSRDVRRCTAQSRHLEVRTVRT